MQILKPMIKTVAKDVVNGRRNLPRYLYHITNKANYEKILQEGVIKAAHDTAPETNLSGVFMFDLKNFTKRWCHMGFDIGTNSGENLLTLAKALFIKSSSKSSDIVVLRIPTRNLPLDKLKCRMQSAYESLSHAFNGDAATRQKHYTRKRQAVEYIFQDDIPVNNIQKAGEANTGIILEDMMTDDMSMHSSYKKLNPKEILSNLFKGQPEEKCIQIANNSNIKFRKII